MARRQTKIEDNLTNEDKANCFIARHGIEAISETNNQALLLKVMDLEKATEENAQVILDIVREKIPLANPFEQTPLL